MEYLVATYRTLGVSARRPAGFNNGDPNAHPVRRGAAADPRQDGASSASSRPAMPTPERLPRRLRRLDLGRHDGQRLERGAATSSTATAPCSPTSAPEKLLGTTAAGHRRRVRRRARPSGWCTRAARARETRPDPRRGRRRRPTARSTPRSTAPSAPSRGPSSPPPSTTSGEAPDGEDCDHSAFAAAPRLPRPAPAGRQPGRGVAARGGRRRRRRERRRARPATARSTTCEEAAAGRSRRHPAALRRRRRGHRDRAGHRPSSSPPGRRSRPPRPAR